LKLAGEVQELAVSFFGQRVLRGLSLVIPRNRLTVIIGPSGSGKTTLLRALNRLNEFFPGADTRGTVRLHLEGAWVDVYGGDLSVTGLRRRVGLVFQQPHILPVSIAKNITLPLKLVAGLSRRDLPARMEQVLREAHLWDEVKDRLASPAAALSGGQQQRLCLARALALEPEILLLDEPSASLDFRAASRVEELLADLKDRYTLVAVSHSLSQARRIADQIAVLKEGVIVRMLERTEFDNQSVFHRLIEENF